MTSRRQLLVLTAALLGGCKAGAGPDKGARRPVGEGQMTAKLREAVAKAAHGQGSDASLELDYSKGHELSGITHFQVDGAGRYRLTSNVTEGRKEFTTAGVLEAAERDGLFVAVENARLLDLASSTRNIGDDEEPVIVTLRRGDQSRRLMLWHDDAVRNPDFHGFEEHLLGLVRKLSAGAVRSTAN